MVVAHKEVVRQPYNGTFVDLASVATLCDNQLACWCHWASLFDDGHCPGSGAHCPGCQDLAGVHAFLATLAQTRTRRNLTLDAPIELGAPSVGSDTEPAKKGKVLIIGILKTVQTKVTIL